MTTLNDLSLEQLLKFNTLHNLAGVTASAKRILIAEAVSGLHRDEVTAAEDDEDVRLDLLERFCAEYHDPFFEVTETPEGDKHYSLRLTLTKCPYPEVEFENAPKHFLLNQQNVYACADGWSNMTIYEMSYVWRGLELFYETGEETHLHQVLAVIYRPSRRETEEELISDWRGDRRRGLYGEESSIRLRVPYWAKVHPMILQLLALWLVSCRAQIVDQFPVIFASDQVKPDPDAPDFGWAGLMLAVADGPANLEAIANHKWSTIFLHLAKLEHDRLEANTKKAHRSAPE